MASHIEAMYNTFLVGTCIVHFIHRLLQDVDKNSSFASITQCSNVSNNRYRYVKVTAKWQISNLTRTNQLNAMAAQITADKVERSQGTLLIYLNSC